MKYITLFASLIFLSLGFWACSSTSAPEGTNVILNTERGKIYIKLYDDTPKHKENFLKLAKEGFYDGIEFHRVIPNFMVQAGNPDTKPDKKKEGPLNDNDAGYKLDAEIVPTHTNVRGALAAARDMNPEWKSSGSQFYIVTGKAVTDKSLDTAEFVTTRALQERLEPQFLKENPAEEAEVMRLRGFADKQQKDSVNAIGARLSEKFRAYVEKVGVKPFKYTPEQRKAYTEKGGFPFLDGQYTVFGEVLKGIEVAEDISKVETEAPANRPKTPIRILSTTVLK